jgi:hypothetical protein
VENYVLQMKGGEEGKWKNGQHSTSTERGTGEAEKRERKEKETL